MSCGGVGGKAIKAPRVPEVYEIGVLAGEGEGAPPK